MPDPPADPSSELAPRPRDPEIDRIARIGTWLAAAESSDTSPNAMGAAAALRLMLARELGLPLRAASELSMIKGRLVISAALLRALAHRAGYRVVRLKAGPETCTAAIIDAQGRELGRSTFTLTDAKRAGLVKAGGNWTTYPERMLWARASTWAVRDFLPDVALGLTTADEAAEIEGQVVVEVGEPEPPAPEPPQDELDADAAWEESGKPAA